MCYDPSLKPSQKKIENPFILDKDLFNLILNEELSEDIRIILECLDLENHPTYRLFETIREEISKFYKIKIKNNKLGRILGFSDRYITNKYYDIKNGKVGGINFEKFQDNVKNNLRKTFGNSISTKLKSILNNYDHLLIRLTQTRNYKKSIKASKKYHPNLKVNYFENIDSIDKAYWLGWLYADGAITEGHPVKNNHKSSRRIKFQLKADDEIIINRFMKTIGLESKFKRLEKSYNKQYDKWYYSYAISFSNQKMIDDLIKNGVFHRKSKEIELPYLNNHNLYLAFLLGYYDGDGEQGTTRIQSGSYVFLKQIKRKFKIKNKIDYESGGYRLYLGPNLLCNMLNIYKDSIPRKREAAKRFFHKH